MYIKILDQIVDWRIALVGHLDEATEEILYTTCQYRCCYTYNCFICGKLGL